MPRAEIITLKHKCTKDEITLYITYNMSRNFYIFVNISLFISGTGCESTTETTESLLKTYSNYINASHDLDKSDRVMMKQWHEDFQLQLVNITSQYRLTMTRHKEHSFMVIKANLKWKECINLHQIVIDNAEGLYFQCESKCLKSANAKEKTKKRSVIQTGKEIRKWRKSYRYLKKQCDANHPGDDEAIGECLVQYMQKDNYHITFQRLILLKLQAMSDLYAQIVSCQVDLENCLKTTLSRYLESVRSIMKSLDRCCNIKSVD